MSKETEDKTFAEELEQLKRDYPDKTKAYEALANGILYMTQEEKITYMATALNICKYSFNKKQTDLFVSLYDLILSKEGETDLKSIYETVSAHELRFPESPETNTQ